MGGEKFVLYSASQVMFIKLVLPELDVQQPLVSPQMLPKAVTSISHVSLFSHYSLIQLLYLLSQLQCPSLHLPFFPFFSLYCLLPFLPFYSLSAVEGKCVTNCSISPYLFPIS